MEVIVDGDRNAELQVEHDTVGSLLSEIDDSLRRRGRAMLKIAVDGEDIPPDGLMEALGERSLDDIQSIEVESEDLVALAQSSLREMEEVLPELSSVCHSLAEVFHSDSAEEGFEKLVQLAEIWQAVKVRQIDVVSALELDLESLKLDGVSLVECFEETSQYLGKALDALEARDCVLLGDLLEYELAPRAEIEAKIVALLQSQIRERAG